MPRIISGSSIVRGRLKRWNCTAWRMRPQALTSGGMGPSRLNAAFRRQPFWNSIRLGTSFIIGAVLTVKGIYGPIQIMALRWTTKETSGSAETVSVQHRVALLRPPDAELRRGDKRPEALETGLPRRKARA